MAAVVNWQTMDKAPREGDGFWALLPSRRFTADAAGRPSAVEHSVERIRWNAERSAWVTVETGDVVYPSQWTDALSEPPVPEGL